MRCDNFIIYVERNSEIQETSDVQNQNMTFVVSYDFSQFNVILLWSYIIPIIFKHIILTINLMKYKQSV